MSIKPNRPQRTPPERGAQHEALEVFLGDWKAEGQSFGGPNQDSRNPRGNPTRWTSTHSARWHTGKFFLIQDERAQVDGPFDTLSVLGFDDDAGRYFAHTFENHGYCRRYDVSVEGKVWTISGKTERARIEFSDDGKRQTITWEWRRKRNGWRCATAWRRNCDAQRRESSGTSREETDMRFMVLIKTDRNSEAGVMPSDSCSPRWVGSTRIW